MTDTYVKGDQTRVVETASDRVAAQFDGFVPAEANEVPDDAEVDNPDAPDLLQPDSLLHDEGSSTYTV